MIRQSKAVTIVGGDTKRSFRLSVDALDCVISTAKLTSIDLHPEDQVAVLGSGLTMKAAHLALKEVGQSIPVAEGANPVAGTIGGAVSMNFPHPYESQLGSWRDWVLGMQVVLADGSIAKTGSKAVKNVAGYDVHKLLVGARGTLGVIVSVIVKTYPIGKLPERQSIRGPALAVLEDWVRNEGSIPYWIQRTRKTDFELALKTAGDSLLEADLASSTLWALVPGQAELPRYPHDWVIRTGCGSKNLQLTDATQIALMRRAKDIFDPTHKLNPGEMGIF